jgi:16S rRNA G1207 methylase RsmC
VTPEHYFTRTPTGDNERHPLTLTLAGRRVQVNTAGGVFSSRRLDTGTAVLLNAVPAPPEHGDLVDLGCGWGPIALTLALRSPQARVWALDVNERALDLTRENARGLGLTNVRAMHPDEMPPGVRVDALWSNPPIRVGKEALHGMLGHWLPRLATGASAWLVVQKNLGSDSLERWLGTIPGFATLRVLSKKGYRVLRVEHGGPESPPH